MIAQERLYDYQEQFEKYIEAEPRQPRPRRDKESLRRLGAEYFAGKDKKLILGLLLIVTAALIMTIMMTSYAASIRYEISVTEAENSALWDDIKQMQSSQSTMNGVGYVENKAGDELGMKYAGTERCIYVTNQDVPPAGFADVLKSKAYN